MAGQAYAETSHLGMNTVMTHRAYGRYAADALRAVGREAVRLEAMLSRFVPGSDVSRLNGAAGKRRVKLHRETFAVLDRAAEVSAYSQGAFDVTAGPLIALWSAARQSGDTPDESAIRRALTLVGSADMELRPRARSAGLATPGQTVDLGGIGKGYAADLFIGVFRGHGVSSAFTNIGGNVAALGTKPDGGLWRVGIRHPRREGELIGSVCVADRSVVTSGDYQRYFTGRDGRRYHHILDPATGYPADSGLAGVTAVAASSMDADALSTALFVLGMEKGLGVLKRFLGSQALFVATDMRVYATSGLRCCFQAADGVDVEFIDI